MQTTTQKQNIVVTFGATVGAGEGIGNRQMTNDTDFLSDLMSRPWSPDAKHGFRPVGLFVGKGANAIEVVVAHSSSSPTRTALLESWKVRRGGRAAPVLLVVLNPGGAALCGASGEEPPVYPKIDPGQVVFAVIN